MVDTVGISGKKGKLKGQLGLEQEKLRKAKLRGNPQEIRKIELRIKSLTKLGKKREIGKGVKGSSGTFSKKAKTPAEQASIFDPEKGAFADIWKKKKKKKSEMQKEIEKRSGQSAEEMYGTGLFAADPGGPMSDDLEGIEEPYGTSDWRGFSGPVYDSEYGFKHGGRIKKSKKRKRAALRGYRAELRGG